MFFPHGSDARVWHVRVKKMKRTAEEEESREIVFPIELFLLILESVDTMSRFRFAQTSKSMKELVYKGTTILVDASRRMTDVKLKRMRNLIALNLRDNQKVTDKSLRLLTRLECLNVKGAKGITSKSLLRLTNLTSLTLDDTLSITYKTLKNATQLRELDFTQKNVDYGTGRVKSIQNALTQFPSLTSLSLKNDTLVSNKHIQKLTNLKMLTLSGKTKITDKGLGFLTNLSTLHLEENKRITGSCFEKLTQLTELVFRPKMGVVEESIHLTNLINLKSLKIEACLQINDILPHLTNLTSLAAGFCPILLDDSLSLLANLTHLDLSHTGASFECISKMTSLTSIVSDITNPIFCQLAFSNDSNIKMINNKRRENFTFLDLFGL